jgi:hypothetical protein
MEGCTAPVNAGNSAALVQKGTYDGAVQGSEYAYNIIYIYTNIIYIYIYTDIRVLLSRTGALTTGPPSPWRCC